MRTLGLLLFSIVLSGCIQTSNFDSGYLVPAAEQPVELKFNLLNGLIVIDAEVNGEKGRFLFDNGFSLSAINSEFALKAGISFQNKSNIIDANNKRSKISETIVETVDIKGQVFKNTGFYNIDTSTFFPCVSIDGIIGASIINKANWQINFEEKTIRISADFFASKGFKLDVDFSTNNSAFVEIEVLGNNARAKIDFGKRAQLDLRKELFVDFFSGKYAEERAGILSLSANGLSEQKSNYYLSKRYPIKSGDSLFGQDLKVRLIEKLKYEAYLGIDFFKGYLVTLNSTQGQYVLEDIGSPFSHQGKLESLNKSYGVSIYLVDGKWKVINTNPNNEQSSQLALMSEVQYLDGMPISRFDSICAYRDYLENKINLGQNLYITLLGSEQVIELKLIDPTQVMIQ